MSSWGTSTQARLPAGRHFSHLCCCARTTSKVKPSQRKKNKKTNATHWELLKTDTNVSCFRLMALKISHSATCLPLVMLWADRILVSTESWRLLLSLQSCCRSWGSFDVTPTHFVQSGFVSLTSDSEPAPPPSPNTNTHNPSPFVACW